MKNIKNLIFSIFLLLISVITINVNAATKIKENSNDFTSDVYIIGGTKFDADFALTAPRAITATVNQMGLNNRFNYDLEMSLKLYYFSELTGEWYEIPEDGGKVIPVTEEEKEVLEDDLTIFYVNNDEKILEFTPNIPVEGDIHEDFGVKYEDGKFLVPATQTYFIFTTTNNKEAIVSTTPIISDEGIDFDLGNLYIEGVNVVVRAYDYKDKDNIENVDYRNQFYVDENGALFFGEFGDPYSSLYSSHDEYAVIEYVDKEGNPIDVLNMTFKEGDVIYQKLEKAAFETNGIKYTLSELKNKLESGYYVRLITDVELTEDLILDQENSNINFDLGENTLSCKGNCKRIIRVNGKNSFFSIQNGTINAGNAQGITVGQQTTEFQNINVNVSNNLIINADTFGITIFGNGTNLNFAGTINIKNDGYGISGNGSDGYSGTNITINDGAKINATHENGFALYIPQNGVVDIYGGKLTGASVIGIKSGQLNIYGGELTATGNKVIPVYPTNDGTESTGDVIYVEMNDNYAKNVNININENVILSSKNAGKVLVYNSNSEETPIVNYTNHYTIDITYDENGKPYTRYLPTSEADIEIDNSIYYTKAAALELIDKTTTGLNVKLLKDIVLDKDIILDTEGDSFNFDLNGKTLSCNGNCKRIIRVNGKNSSFTIGNGTINAGSAQGITVGQQTTEEQNIHVTVNDATINADTFGITVFGKSANLSFAGTINIKNDGYGISGNGSAGYGGTNITINEGAIINATAENGFALYIPQEGTVNIEGGTLTGASVVGIKSGVLNVMRGTLKATGNKVIPVYPTNDGTESTGDVIYVEMNDNYAKKVYVTIHEEAILESKNAGNLLVYNSNSEEVPYIYYTNNTTLDKSYDENGKLYTRYLADSAAEFEINSQLFTTTAALEHLDSLEDNLYVNLKKDVVLPKDIIFDKDNYNIYFDLGGHKLSCDGNCKRIIRVNGKNSTLEIQNGTINAGSAQGITVGQQSEVEQNIWVTVRNDVTINADTFGITVFGKNANLSFAGTINIKNDGYGISGNGTDGYGGTSITVENGAKINATHEDGFALYLPQEGTAVINGGELTAASVIGIKAGSLSIWGGTLTATGNKFTALSPTNDGTKSTGDAIFVEINKNYARNIIIDIMDAAIITSTNGNIIQSYKSNIDEANFNETINTLNVSSNTLTETVDAENNRLSTFN